MKKFFLISHFTFCCLFGWAQQEIKKDTVNYYNLGKKIDVIQTTIKQYYNDSTCVWEISYPQVKGIDDPDIQASKNKEFAAYVSFGDCEMGDEECEQASEQWYPRMQYYYNKVEVVDIKNNLMSYKLSEGGQPVGYKRKFGEVEYFIFDLKSGEQIEEGDLFSFSGSSKSGFDQLLILKLGFTPDEEPFQTMRQYYFNEGDLVVYFDRYTIGEDQEYHIKLSYIELKAWMKKEGAIMRYFEM